MRVRRGLSSPVRVAPAIDWQRDYSEWTDAFLLALPEAHLPTVDPLAMTCLSPGSFARWLILKSPRIRSK
jgi:hypothetical protein